MTLGLTEQGKFYEKYNDPSPLTEETLKELGFEKSFGTVNRYELTINGVELYYYGGETKVEVDIHFVESTYSYKTIGSVKMLIEALKGEGETE